MDENKDLRKLIQSVKPFVYHCTTLDNVYSEDKDIDILEKGILDSNSLKKFDNPHEEVYGGPLAQESAGKKDHFSVWVYSEDVGKLEEHMNMIRSREISFVLSTRIEYELVGEYTEADDFHRDEGFVEGPLDITCENIEMVIIGKKSIEDNYKETISSIEMDIKIDKIKSELEDRGIPVFETEEREY